jgi:hypothetical protein
VRDRGELRAHSHRRRARQPGYIKLGHAADLAHEYDLAVMEASVHAMLDAAWAAGVRYFDGAPLVRPRQGVPRRPADDASDPARRTHCGLEVGVHVHGRLASCRRKARGQGPYATGIAPPVLGELHHVPQLHPHGRGNGREVSSMQLTSIHEANMHLSQLIRRAMAGEEFVIGRACEPLMPSSLTSSRRRPRPTT